MADIPEGVEIEAAAPRREGTVVETGGCADFSKAVLVIRAADEPAAFRLIDEDVYTLAGVWQAPAARPFGRVRLTSPG
jgi:uncharacterized protein YciI